MGLLGLSLGLIVLIYGAILMFWIAVVIVIPIRLGQLVRRANRQIELLQRQQQGEAVEALRPAKPSAAPAPAWRTRAWDEL